MIYNMSSGFDAEIADDIPVEWAGYTLEAVTLWMGEWFSMGGPEWRDPLGMRLNLYQESCPPEMVPSQTIEIDWIDLEKTLVYDSGGSMVYEVVIPVSPALTITPGMSIGATVLIDWGHDEPFAGICATSQYVSYGACVAHLDATWWGYARWTPIDFYTTIPQDLGFCLSGQLAAAPDWPAAAKAILSASPNPILGRTTLSYDLAAPGKVRLSLHDVTGRCVRVLQEGYQWAGPHHLTWDATDGSGSALPAGAYLARLQTAEQDGSIRVLLLESE